MSATSTSNESTAPPRHTLAFAISEIDTKFESRNCRHDGCHGTLQVIENDIVICNSCRVTPHGIYLSPDELSSYGWEDRAINASGTVSSNRGRLGSANTPSNPKGKRGEDHRPRYDNSKEVRMAGGFEEVYDEDDEERPRGVSDSYTWNLTPF